MLTKENLDMIATQAIHIAEFRLLHHRDVPASTHKTIQNVFAQVRDDIAHHPVAKAILQQGAGL